MPFLGRFLCHSKQKCKIYVVYLVYEVCE
jgi:hypothetical protein